MVAADTFCRSQTDILADELLAKEEKIQNTQDLRIYTLWDIHSALLFRPIVIRLRSLPFNTL